MWSILSLSIQVKHTNYYRAQKMFTLGGFKFQVQKVQRDAA